MQLQAVQNGGGMSLLAGRLGHVRLAQPVRFHAEWEQAATLRLREGDATVLTEYDEHARITGGDPEEMMDAAASRYVTQAATGADVLLLAADHALRRELSRRVREDLLRLGLVRPGHGATGLASGGTWIEGRTAMGFLGRVPGLAGPSGAAEDVGHRDGPFHVDHRDRRLGAGGPALLIAWVVHGATYGRSQHLSGSTKVAVIRETLSVGADERPRGA